MRCLERTVGKTCCSLHPSLQLYNLEAYNVTLPILHATDTSMDGKPAGLCSTTEISQGCAPPLRYHMYPDCKHIITIWMPQRAIPSYRLATFALSSFASRSSCEGREILLGELPMAGRCHNVL